MLGSVLIYGGCGALGKKCVEIFKEHKYTIVSIDLNANTNADYNVIVDGSKSLNEQNDQVLVSLNGSVIAPVQFDAILCVAGGWAGGNAADTNLANNVFSLEKQCIWTSVICASMASKFLKEEGCLVLTGAKVATGATPTMLGYGLAKAAVHQLTKSLADKDSGLPNASWVGAILPVTLDTEANRHWMATADFSTWTPLEYVANLLLQWTSSKVSRPHNGALVELVTKDNATTLSLH